MKPITLTRHAETRLRERVIPFAWVERTARNPSWTEPEPADPTLQRRFATIPEFGDRALRVVCAETPSEIRVITVTFDRGARPSP
jgi:hypothetical protein